MTDTASTPLDTADRTAAQLREFGDRAAVAGRELGEVFLDTYEKAVTSFVEFEQRAADATGNDLVKAAVAAHAQFIDDLNSGYIKAMRDALHVDRTPTG